MSTDYRSMFQDLLVLLCFSKKSAPILAHSLKLDYFDDPVYRDIASRAMGYYLKYKQVPEKTIYNLCEDVINGKDKRKSEEYAHTIELIWRNQLSAQGSEPFTMESLHEFISFKQAEIVLREYATLLDNQNHQEFWKRHRSAIATLATTFDFGIKITDVEEALKILNNNELYVSTGIPELDKIGVCPRPGELFVITGLSGKGKTWFAHHLVKHAFLAKPDQGRHKICHISLEMSRGRTIQRYYQSFFAISTDPQGAKTIITFPNEKKNHGRITEFDSMESKPRFAFSDPDAEDKLRREVSKLKHDNLIMKDWPPGQLTMEDLYAYIEGLDAYQDFRPDILILDYPDLMKLDTRDIRISIGTVYKELKGLAREKNMAIIVPAQSNRSGEGANVITKKNIAEDASKIHIADVHITYNQTDEEHKRGLARLFVDKNRNGRSNDIILISQDYAKGQFCHGSTLFDETYRPEIGEIRVDQD